MENVLICLILMLLLVIANVISRLTYALPAPIIQISVGALISFFCPALHIGFNPELFMLLFIPPLLFSESWRFPKREFILNTKPIILLSIGLVFFTVGGLGYAIHWFVPIIPLPACFALAAALSPTDAVALKSMTARCGMPERLRHILQGEALLNDASGLVSFKFAVTALLTGTFSFADATLSLMVIGVGGMIIGILLTYVFVSILGSLNRRHDDETTTENLLLILLPYTAYLVAEQFSLSGVLAAVAAGFAIDKTGFLDKTMVSMRIEGRFVWGMLEVTLNGIIFILLGLYLPSSFTLLANTGTSFSNCLAIVCIITLMLVAYRFIWICLTFPMKALLQESNYSKWSLPNLKIISVLSLGGIRGAIALAAILSLPELMPSKVPFPERDLLITLVVGVVLCSLLLSTVLLPWLLPYARIMTKKSPVEEEIEARLAAARAGIRAIEYELKSLITHLNDEDAALCMQVGHGLIVSLNQFIAASVGDELEKNNSIRALNFEDTLRLAGFQGARHELHQLLKNGKINNTTLRIVLNHLDLSQISIVNKTRSTIEINTI